MPTDVLTGRAGEFSISRRNVTGPVTRVARTTQWEVSPTLDTSTEWGDSDGAGYTLRAPGRRGATFTAEGKYTTNSSVFILFQEGDISAAFLWMNTTLFWHFPRAMCSDFGLLVNVDTEEVEGWTGSWGNDGIYYRPGESNENPTYPTPAS